MVIKVLAELAVLDTATSVTALTLSNSHFSGRTNDTKLFLWSSFSSHLECLYQPVHLIAKCNLDVVSVLGIFYSDLNKHSVVVYVDLSLLFELNQAKHRVQEDPRTYSILLVNFNSEKNCWVF